MNHAGIRSALSRIAWAYLLIHLHFRLNNLDLCSPTGLATS